MMSAKRREAILESLRAGNRITWHWEGGNSSGYMSYSLSDIKLLRESEFKELRRAQIIIPVKWRDNNGWTRTGYGLAEEKTR